jgi:hypothetical protein
MKKKSAEGQKNFTTRKSAFRGQWKKSISMYVSEAAHLHIR